MSVFIRYDERDAPIAQGAAGTTQVKAAVPGWRIRVTGYTVVMSAAGTFKFSDGADKTGAMTCASNGGVSSRTPFICAEGAALSIISTVGACNGHVSYQIVPA